MDAEAPIRVFVGSDTHCGSLTGLTPVSYDDEPADTSSARHEIWKHRREFYAQFANEVERFQPFDFAIWNGDLIDGDQSRSKGQELLEPDRLAQAQMAISVVKKVGAPVNFFIHGTAYHTGPDHEDYEQMVADQFDAQVVKELNVDIGGVAINAVHHVATTQNINTRNNGLGKVAADLTWRVGRGDLERLPALAFRGHRHYYGENADSAVKVIGLPALQFTNDAKWARGFTLPQDYGFVALEIEHGLVKNYWHSGWALSAQETVVAEMVERATDETRAGFWDSVIGSLEVGPNGKGYPESSKRDRKVAIPEPRAFTRLTP